jgi:hypothetical protein
LLVKHVRKVRALLAQAHAIHQASVQEEAEADPRRARRHLTYLTDHSCLAEYACND